MLYRKILFLSEQALDVCIAQPEPYFIAAFDQILQRLQVSNLYAPLPDAHWLLFSDRLSREFSSLSAVAHRWRCPIQGIRTAWKGVTGMADSRLHGSHIASGLIVRPFRPAGISPHHPADPCSIAPSAIPDSARSGCPRDPADADSECPSSSRRGARSGRKCPFR